jgi:hypothetical protein
VRDFDLLSNFDFGGDMLNNLGLAYAKDSMTPGGGNTKSHHPHKFAMNGLLESPADESLQSVYYHEEG